MLESGFDAFGVDVGEWWNADRDILWHYDAEIDERVVKRLSVTDERAYRLPYPDSHFDFAISSQVFEHVFNYVEVFREIGRVLRPGAISVHIFPGRNYPVEPHLGIPVTALAHSPSWLRVWSLIRRKHFSGWSDEYKYLHSAMEPNNYPSRRQLAAFAVEAGVSIQFVERLYIECSNSRPGRIIANAQRAGIGWVVGWALERICQRAMIISKRINL
jgi:SAM-dependent methyltransferase